VTADRKPLPDDAGRLGRVPESTCSFSLR
jgi:hypothetical protein